MTRRWLPAFMLAAPWLVLGAVNSIAQTPDGETPAEEVLCNMESGAAFGLCNAYCEAMDCHLASDGDPDTNPSASATACERVRSQFTRVTGRDVPCEQAGACPCFDPENWGEPEGVIWRNFATGAFNPAATTCTQTPTLIKLVEAGSEALTGAAVDAAVPECQVFIDDAEAPLLTLAILAEEVAACRGLLLTAGTASGTCLP